MTRILRSRFGILAILLLGIVIGFVVAHTYTLSLVSVDLTEVKSQNKKQAEKASLRLWRFSDKNPGTCTKHAVDHLRKALTWDLKGRQGLTDPRGNHFELHEFDFEKMNQVVYQEKGGTTSGPDLRREVCIRFVWLE